MAVLDLETISIEASRARPGRALLTAIAFFFYALGWLLGRLVELVWVGTTWAYAAAKVGWQDGRRGVAFGTARTRS